MGTFAPESEVVDLTDAAPEPEVVDLTDAPHPQKDVVDLTDAPQMSSVNAPVQAYGAGMPPPPQMSMPQLQMSAQEPVSHEPPLRINGFDPATPGEFWQGAKDAVRSGVQAFQKHVGRPASEELLRSVPAAADSAASPFRAVGAYANALAQPDVPLADRFTQGYDAAGRELTRGIQAGGVLPGVAQIFPAPESVREKYEARGNSTTEFLAREALKAWGGEEAIAMSPDDAAHAVNELERYFGKYAPHVQFAAEQAGMLPLFFLNPGAKAVEAVAARELANAIPSLGSKLGPVLDAAVQAGAQSAGALAGRTGYGAVQGYLYGVGGGSKEPWMDAAMMGGLSGMHAPVASGLTKAADVLVKKPTQYVVGLAGKQLRNVERDLWKAWDDALQRPTADEFGKLVWGVEQKAQIGQAQGQRAMLEKQYEQGYSQRPYVSEVESTPVGGLERERPQPVRTFKIGQEPKDFAPSVKRVRKAPDGKWVGETLEYVVGKPPVVVTMPLGTVQSVERFAKFHPEVRTALHDPRAEGDTARTVNDFILTAPRGEKVGDRTVHDAVMDLVGGADDPTRVAALGVQQREDGLWSARVRDLSHAKVDGESLPGYTPPKPAEISTGKNNTIGLVHASASEVDGFVTVDVPWSKGRVVKGIKFPTAALRTMDEREHQAALAAETKARAAQDQADIVAGLRAQSPSEESSYTKYLRDTGVLVTPERLGATRDLDALSAQKIIDAEVAAGNLQPVAPGVYHWTEAPKQGLNRIERTGRMEVTPQREPFITQGKQVVPLDTLVKLDPVKLREFYGTVPDAVDMKARASGMTAEQIDATLEKAFGDKPPEEAIATRTFEPGTRVITGSESNIGETALAVYRGPSKTPGFSKVEYFDKLNGTNVMLELPNELVGAHRPLGIADKPLEPVKPEQFVPLRANAKEWEAAMNSYKSQADIVARTGGRRVLQQLIKSFTAGYQQGSNPFVGMTWARLHNATKVRDTETMEILESMRNLYAEKGLRGQKAKDIVPIAKAAPGAPRLEAMEEFIQKHPEVAIDDLNTMLANLHELKAHEGWLAEHGIELVRQLELARGQGLFPEYLNRSFGAWKVSKDLREAFMRKSGKWGKGIDLIKRESPTPLSDERAEELLRNFVNMDPATMSNATRGTHITQEAKTLRERTAKPEWREVLDELQSGPIQIAESLANVRTLRRTVRAWEDLANSPYASNAYSELTPVQIPNQPVFGNARGKWVPEEFKSFLDPASTKKGADMVNSLFRVTGGHVKKMQTVFGGAAQWLNNAARMLRGEVLSGSLDFSNMEAWKKHHVEAARMMRDIHNNPTIDGPNALLIEARERGVLGSGASGLDREFESKYLQRKVYDALYDGSLDGSLPSALERVQSTGAKALRGLAASVDEVARVYGMMDEWSKLAQYLHVRETFIQRGLSPTEAADYAARRVLQSNPAYNMLSPAMGAVRDYAGVFNPYAHAAGEDMRVLGGIPTRLNRTMQAFLRGDKKSPDYEPELIKNLMGLGIVTVGAMEYADQRARINGMTPRYRKALIESQTDAVKAMRTPGMSVHFEFDEQGRPQVFDWWHQFEPIAHLFSTVPEDPQLLTVARNFGSDILGGPDTLFGGLNELGFGQLGVTPHANFTPAPPVGGGDLGTAAGYLMRGGAIPGVINQMRNVQSKLNPSLMVGEQWTKGQAAAKMLGLPFVGPLGDQSQLQSALEMKRKGATEPIRDIILEMKRLTPRSGATPESTRAVDAMINKRLGYSMEVLERRARDSQELQDALDEARGRRR